jgi:formylglycine-generating enzyme required for sulfatase activity
MGKYVVTNAQWQAIMGMKPSEKYDVKFQGENQPVVSVSWDDAKEFCQKASQ